MIKKIIYTIIMLPLLLSCKEITQKAAEKILEKPKEELPGKYHTIKNERMKIFLPEEFSYISGNDFKKFFKNDTVILNSHQKKVAVLKSKGRKLYIFEYFKGSSIVNVFMEDYIPFNNHDANNLLYYINQSLNANLDPDATSELIQSQYKGNKNLNIFKAIYKISSPKSPNIFFKHIYFISYNKRSFFVSLETFSEIDFDPYIQKIRL